MPPPLLLLLASLFFVYSCSSVPVTGRKQLMMVSSGRIYKLAEKSYNNILDEYDLSEDEDEIIRLNRIGKRLISGMKNYFSKQQINQRLNKVNWTFELIDSPEQNAIALPNGKILVFKGLLQICKNDNGIAVVLAHEMAHIIAKHEWERKSHLKMRNFGAIGVSTILLNSSTPGRELALTSFGVVAAYGFVLPFERKHEMEADEMGLHFLAMAGYDLLEAERFWKRMEERSGNNGREPAFFSTHPSPGKRLERLRELAPKVMKQYVKP